MVSRIFSLFGGFAVAISVATVAMAPEADAASRDQVFFESAAGSWKGPGEIVAGKYKGTKFTCNLIGEATSEGEAGLKLDGTCRVGVFKQPMNATIIKTAKGYTGKFLDGAEGKGLDITTGSLNGERIVLGINRAKLNGAMVASMKSDNDMNITISVKVEEQMIPVIGMTLTRDLDQMAVGSIKN